MNIYRESPDSTNSISTIPGLVRLANRTIFTKFPGLVRFWNFGRLRDASRNVPILKSKQTEFVRQIAAGQKVHRPSPTVITLRNLSNLSIFAFQQNA